MTDKKYYYAIGRRKTAVATVRLFEEGGVSVINQKNIEDVYKSTLDINELYKPFLVTQLDPKKFHFSAKVEGSGKSSQLGAIKLGIARAIVKLDSDKKKALKDEGLLTRDPRMVERKKIGRRKARKSEQYSKR